MLFSIVFIFTCYILYDIQAVLRMSCPLLVISSCPYHRMVQYYCKGRTIGLGERRSALRDAFSYLQCTFQLGLTYCMGRSRSTAVPEYYSRRIYLGTVISPPGIRCCFIFSQCTQEPSSLSTASGKDAGARFFPFIGQMRLSLPRRRERHGHPSIMPLRIAQRSSQSRDRTPNTSH